jgi:hypothetical protein
VRSQIGVLALVYKKEAAMADAEEPSTVEQRIEELEAVSKRRAYEKKRDEAGFAKDADYDAWLLLEKLRTLTLAEREADKEVGGFKVGHLPIETDPAAFQRRWLNDRAIATRMASGGALIHPRF